MWPRSKPRPCGWTARSDFFDGRRRAAGIIAVTALGIDQVEAEALPEQKSEIVKLRRSRARLLPGRGWGGGRACA